jgi:hypothetical protein
MVAAQIDHFDRQFAGDEQRCQPAKMARWRRRLPALELPEAQPEEGS